EPRLAVDVADEMPASDERALRPCRDGDRFVAKVVEDPDRVSGGLGERLVSRDGRDPEQFDLRAPEREHERDRVVVSGVAVDDDPGHAASIRSTSLAVGSDGWAPGREAASAPAAHARPSASPRSRPSRRDTTSAAQNASPAAVPSTACTSGARARAT